MRKNIIAGLALLCSAVAAVGMSTPASAQLGQNSIGPSVAIGGGQTAIRIDSKFGIADM
ncbi:hypothetical protein [Chamaesiphon sp.]|uniref:hypothetical protein n=1 Tax=Chamaesiphon sp. TaxID=2814140 RepID=UPI003593573A